MKRKYLYIYFSFKINIDLKNSYISWKTHLNCSYTQDGGIEVSLFKTYIATTLRQKGTKCRF